MRPQSQASNADTPAPEVLAYIALGSNLGDRQTMLDQALQALRAEPGLRVSKVSSFYATAPVGGPPGQDPYLNGVIEVATTLTPDELLARLLFVEQRLGRKRKQRWGPRCLDLDLLLYDQAVINQPDLQVPHPLMHQREFVLRGLAQIAPGLKHPLSGATAEQMWQNLRPRQKGT